jgi:hypothetical protein
MTIISLKTTRKISEIHEPGVSILAGKLHVWELLVSSGIVTVVSTAVFDLSTPDDDAETSSENPETSVATVIAPITR